MEGREKEGKPTQGCIIDLAIPVGNRMFYPTGPTVKACEIHLRTVHPRGGRGKKHLFIRAYSQLVKDCPTGH